MGFTAVLHTHNRRRSLHPHLHVIIAGGGYDSKKHVWHKGKKGYLFNALAKVWRARMLDAINHASIMHLPSSVPHQWVVDCRKVGYGLPALKYLSRYLYRGVLPDKDIIKISDKDVTFRYQDRQTKSNKTRTLPTVEFLWLILQHVHPKGLQRVRDYGLMHASARRLQWVIILMLSSHTWQFAPSTNTRTKAKRSCPCCKHDMACVGITKPT